MQVESAAEELKAREVSASAKEAEVRGALDEVGFVVDPSHPSGMGRVLMACLTP